jgi:DNA-binding NtrC family response regulator
MDQEPSIRTPSFLKFILIVENDASIGEYLVQAIHQETPYRALLVVNSQQALEAIQHIKPSLLLLDYHLPSSMNGIELYDAIHSTRGFERIPAIIMSASFPHATIEHEIKKRGLITVPQPHDLNEFLATLKSVLHEQPSS